MRIALPGLLLAMQVAVGAELPAGWQYRASVRAPEGRFVALPLGPDVFDHCAKDDCSDLRLRDLDGGEVPYVLVFEGPLQRDTELRGREINRESPDPSRSRLTVDFGASIEKNQITVETAGVNFRRRLTVDGSGDLRSWAVLLAEGWLIAAGADPSMRFATFDIGPTTYRYIRVSVQKMPEETDAPVISAVSCRKRVTRAPHETTVLGRLTSYASADAGSTAEFDFGRRYLSMRRAALRLTGAPGRLFRKTCTIWGRNTLRHVERVRFETGELGPERPVETPWRMVGRSTVYSDTDGRQSLEIGNPIPFRYVRVRIDDGDSPQLPLEALEGYTVPAYAVFEPAGQSRLTLLAGNPVAATPRFDSADSLARLDSRTLPKCEPVVMREFRQDGVRPEPAGQTAVWFLLTAAVLVTAGFLWKTARSTAG